MMFPRIKRGAEALKEVWDLIKMERNLQKNHPAGAGSPQEVWDDIMVIITDHDTRVPANGD